jgi:hypothetical protein
VNPGLLNRYATSRGAAHKQALGDEGLYSKGGGHPGQGKVTFLDL